MAGQADRARGGDAGRSGDRCSAPDHRGRLRAYRWVAHSAERLATSLTPLEPARTVEEAFDAANGLGTPGQNMVVADRSGRIGWTVYGSIPRRVGLDGRLPDVVGRRHARLERMARRRRVSAHRRPAGGRIWTANARVVDGDMLAKLGDGSYEIGSRATIIRDRLHGAASGSRPRDMLDDPARHRARTSWRAGAS